MTTRNRWAWAFLALPVLGYASVVFVPALFSLAESFTNASILSGEARYVGLDNYARLGEDPAFWNSVDVTAIWTVVGVTIPVAAALVLAVVLNKLVMWSKLVKSLFFLPLALSLVVAGQVWIWMLKPDSGLVNLVLRAVGLESWAQAWLAKSGTALAAVLGAWSWQQIALNVVIFLAGLTAVSADLSEAAKVDGASHWQHFAHVTWPALRPAFVVVGSLSLINSLKSFDLVYIMTGGGPFRSTETLAVFSYRLAFVNYQAGYSSAAVVVLFVLTTAVIGVFFWATGREKKS